ncbi:VTC domain-containig protein [Gottschalkia acidurici 9a]|uniref:VTC domain-containig protein n=1 Tax=Gottschalkia acidurici (strain ATCC 7906 / DSM 604 / BCRC 14475 / CIP 104303 / KCTC 5404 / NCIMB 10678 / 9a) TaxID=1128398 RepID=K0B0E6_GOTA9|nr:polyphosphate polymerase domain-containing protein [Gottschalkia acidurici]AFS79508.1 VTC domain-containig protein [Gottschalkia acidurici 9a]
MLGKRNSIKVRHEYKYLITEGSYLQLKNILDKTMYMDKHSKDSEGYHIRSLYFDDIYDTALNEKYLGIPNRRKFRVRIYNFSDKVIKLEEKIKYDNYIQKKVCSISKSEYEDIFDGNIESLIHDNNSVKKNYYYQIRNNMLRPKVIVDYKREAYTFPFNQIRITFDRGLSAQRPYRNIFDKDLISYNVGQGYENILEVKYDNYLPNHIKNALEMYCHSRLAISKYVICREHLSI